MSPPSKRTGFTPDAGASAHGPRLRDRSRLRDWSSPGERSLPALYNGRITLCYSTIRVGQTFTGNPPDSIRSYSTPRRPALKEIAKGNV
jgi:hypothetical protein